MYRLYKHPYKPVILDDETAEKKFKEWKELHPDATAVTLEEVLEHMYQSRLIKKSENIFDLIEKGDLIAFQYKDTVIRDIETVTHVYKYSDKIDVYTSIGLHNNDKIEIIYKPNSKGDYFIVWERGE